MKTRQLGAVGPIVSRLGLGCMGMSDLYAGADPTASTKTLQQAVDAGVNLFDTGDFYGWGHNELLLAKALKNVKRDRLCLSVKFGALRDPSGAWSGFDGRPKAVKNYLAQSLSKLETDYIDIYRPARLDPDVPIEDTIGAIAEMVQAGYVRYIGLSEVGAETIRRAQAVHPITDLQVEYSLLSRDIEAGTIGLCQELGIGITAYGVLSRGLLSGTWKPKTGDFRQMLPRFQGQNLTHNLQLVEALKDLGATKQKTAAQLAIAWVATAQSGIVPLVGARTPERLSQAFEALEISFTAEELEQLNSIFPHNAAAGTRYDAHGMSIVGI